MPRLLYLTFAEINRRQIDHARTLIKRQRLDLEIRVPPERPAFESDDAERLRPQLLGTLLECFATVCLIGYTTRSDPWVDWELQASREADLALVGIRLHSNLADVPPLALGRAPVVPCAGAAIASVLAWLDPG